MIKHSGNQWNNSKKDEKGEETPKNWKLMKNSTKTEKNKKRKTPKQKLKKNWKEFGQEELQVRKLETNEKVPKK